MKRVRLKINNVIGYSGIVTVHVDADGVVLSDFWRRRIEDAATDNCLEIIKPARNTKEHSR